MSHNNEIGQLRGQAAVGLEPLCHFSRHRVGEVDDHGQREGPGFWSNECLGRVARTPACFIAASAIYAYHIPGFRADH